MIRQLATITMLLAAIVLSPSKVKSDGGLNYYAAIRLILEPQGVGETIAFMGQSNAVIVGYGFEGQVRNYFEREYAKALLPLEREARVHTIAMSGSSIHRRSDPSLPYWINPDLSYGSVLNEVVAPSLNGLGIPLMASHIIWMQGEADATWIQDEYDRLIFKSELEYVLEEIRLLNGNPGLIIGMTLIGFRADGNRMEGVDFVRQTQRELVDEYDDIILVSDNADLPLQDNVHYTLDGFKTLLDRVVAAVTSGVVPEDPELD